MALLSDEGSDNFNSTIKGSDDEEFQIVKRKNKRVARNSSITSKTVTAAKIVASNKKVTVSGANTLKTTNLAGSKLSPPPKNGIPFHTYALKEERKGKVVIKGVPVEIETEDIKANLKRQEYLVQAVHRMHRSDGTALGLVLVILNKTDRATDIFENLANVCGLSGIIVEASYKRGIPGQCYRCQLYGHAATNCHAPPQCLKCLDPHWTKECARTRESGGKLACYNCGSDHTANYGGCSVAPKPKPINSTNKKSEKSNRYRVRWTYLNFAP
ncbi:Nucleic-acid-binding protein from transposon X-element [Eumeta japonica]|uniref:Nucleic-acid-binding protein from transposon X-element n=1 Tax=Eumeta variegata TaxID=151549 RepID=A0A4C1SQP4_EUMVA|nr:Nucleic-acid-binding protein from transposon X-element [Eumeta japonica]